MLEVLRPVAFVLILLLFPWPLALLFVLGVPVGSIYVLVYVLWASFAAFLVWLGSRQGFGRVSKWPHRGLMYSCFVGEFVWYFATHTVLNVSVALNWAVFIALAVVFFLEAAIVRREGAKST